MIQYNVRIELIHDLESNYDLIDNKNAYNSLNNSLIYVCISNKTLHNAENYISLIYIFLIYIS